MDDSDIAKAAIKGVANPAIAIGTANTLYRLANWKFSRMRRCAVLDRAITPIKLSKRCPRKTTSDATRAASSAVAGEIDTCADVSAAVSFNPSPIIKTWRPWACNCVIWAALDSGV